MCRTHTFHLFPGTALVNKALVGLIDDFFIDGGFNFQYAKRLLII
jgi:hypothetical protein